MGAYCDRSWVFLPEATRHSSDSEKKRLRLPFDAGQRSMESEMPLTGQ